jgi:hypothetical protein
MFGFLIKKTFYDLWDNLFKIALINLGFLALVLAGIIVPSLFVSAFPLLLGIMALCLLCCCVYLAASSLCLKALSDYGVFGFADFLHNLASAWPAGILLGVLCLLGFFLGAMAIPFYFSLGSFAGLLLGCFLFWTMLTTTLALQFYLPIRARLDARLVKIIKNASSSFLTTPFSASLPAPHPWRFWRFHCPCSCFCPARGGSCSFSTRRCGSGC